MLKNNPKVIIKGKKEIRHIIKIKEWTIEIETLFWINDPENEEFIKSQISTEVKNKFDYILPIKDLTKWNFVGGRASHKLRIEYLNIKPKYRTKFSAYVPITIGCNNFCTYCVVPYTRGPEISRPTEDILKEIKELIRKKYKEIWLLGENVNSYQYKKINFTKLLKKIDNLSGKFWLRFTSSHPKDFSDELIKTITQGKKITHYINPPVQSGDDRILKRMNRPYSLKDYKNLIKKIKKEIPDAFLSTDVIVGFPGETKKQFQNTLKLFKEIKFDMAYIAQYSPRPGTAASRMKDNVSDKEKKNREKILTEILKKTALENNKKYIGKTVEVLPKYERKGWLIGKTREYRTIKFKISRSPTSRGKSDFNKLIGKFVRVRVINAIPWGLKGVFLEFG